MPVDRNLYSKSITKEGAPNWPCPRCRGGHFRLVPDSLVSSWTGDTRASSSDESFDPSWVELRFGAMLKCDNHRCSEIAVVAGTGMVAERPDEYMGNMSYEDVFSPKYFLPSPRLIDIPVNAPAKVVSELEQAFVASWSDYASAGNRIRAAIERLLDSLRVQRLTVNVKGKREPINLHNRISKIKGKHTAAHDSLIAIKWIGNAGSHSNALTREAVFDALDIFESVLAGLYSKHPSVITRLVKSVNARKGPARKRK